MDEIQSLISWQGKETFLSTVAAIKGHLSRYYHLSRSYRKFDTLFFDLVKHFDGRHLICPGHVEFALKQFEWYQIKEIDGKKFVNYQEFSGF